MTALHRYEASRDADLLMTHLWHQMDTGGDLDRIFADPTYPLSALLRVFAAPNETYYAYDDNGVWFACWFELFAHGTFVSVWFRPDKRSSMASATLFLRVLRAGIQAYGTVIAMSSHAHVPPFLDAMGFLHVGTIPRLLNGRDAGLWCISQATLDARLARPVDGTDRRAQAWRAAHEEIRRD